MRAIRFVRAFLAYNLCLAAVLVVMATFIGLNSWTAVLVHATGLQISPWITGGDPARTVDHGTYSTQIHHPVFRGLLGERDEGFVQVDWIPKISTPVRIDEPIDFDADGSADFLIQWAPRTEPPTLTPLRSAVLGLRSHHELSDRFAIRVNLRNVGP